MQITLDTNNVTLRDIAILEALSAHFTKSSPAVPAGTTVTASNPSAGDSGVSEVAADPLPAATSAPDTKAKRGRKPKAEPAAPAPEPEVEAEPVDDKQIALPLDAVEAMDETVDAAAPAEPAKPLTIDDVRAALQQFTAVKGVPEGIALLKEFNAGRISELKADDYATFVTRCAA